MTVLEPAERADLRGGFERPPAAVCPTLQSIVRLTGTPRAPTTEDRWDEAAGHHSNVVAGKLHNLRRGQSRKEMEASHGEYRHRRAQGE